VIVLNGDDEIWMVVVEEAALGGMSMKGVITFGVKLFETK
jgi:hypothetical protein